VPHPAGAVLSPQALASDHFEVPDAPPPPPLTQPRAGHVLQPGPHS
jgi:hypothetical protein